jgi:hypothetical protein
VGPGNQWSLWAGRAGGSINTSPFLVHLPFSPTLHTSLLFAAITHGKDEMLPVQEALGLDTLVASSSCCGGARDQDIIASGFTPWGPESCPSLDQVLMMAASSTTTTPSSPPPPPGQELDEHNEERRRRRQRRKESNRLSAQRSRARKQQRLEELRAAAARLRAEREGLAARLQALARHGLAVRCQNARLRAESDALSRRLHALQRLARFQLVPRPMPEHQPGAAASAVGLASLMA